MRLTGKTLVRIASVSALAILIISCRHKLAEAEALDLSQTPLQTINDVFAIQTKNGNLSMRVEAPRMERYETDTSTFESFPDGISIYGYTEDGVLESIIVADDGRHITGKKRGADRVKPEIWEAFGNVIIHNVPKQETMETDTIYWDRAHEEIYTDCYVEFFSPDGYLQGTGMRSDDRGANAILYNAVNSYAVAEKDTTAVLVDSVNFIGPLLRK